MQTLLETTKAKIMAIVDNKTHTEAYRFCEKKLGMNLVKTSNHGMPITSGTNFEVSDDFGRIVIFRKYDIAHETSLTAEFFTALETKAALITKGFRWDHTESQKQNLDRLTVALTVGAVL